MSVRSAATLWLVLLAAPVLAQPAAETAADDVGQDEGAEQGTGDAWLDHWLADVDVYAARYREAFVDELVRYHEVPRGVVEQQLEAGVQPRDVYLGCATAHVLGRPCREVMAAWRNTPEQAWSRVLVALEAGGDTDALARIRQGLVASYDRWARPIELDAALRRALPDRAGSAGD